MLVVYGSAHDEHKEEFLLELAAMCGSMQVPYIVGGDFESTSAPWVILVINVNISLIGLILLSSIFQRVQQRRGRDKRMWNPFKMLRTNIGKSSRLYFYFSDPRSH